MDNIYFLYLPEMEKRTCNSCQARENRASKHVNMHTQPY